MGLKFWFNRNKKPKPEPTKAEDILPSIEMEPVAIVGGIMTGGMVIVPDPEPDMAGRKGSAEDIQRAYRKHSGNDEKIKLLQKGITETAAATTLNNTKGWLRLAAYLECVEAALPKVADKEDYLRKMAAFVLNDILKAKLTQTADEIGIDSSLCKKEREAALQEHRLQVFACKGLSPESRQLTVDLALRAACAGNHDKAHVDLLIKAGADIATDSHRPLVNAVTSGHHALAHHLITRHKADIVKAQARAEVVYKDKSPEDKFLAYACACALNDMTAESIKSAGYHGGGYAGKKPLLAKVIETYEGSGDASLLAHFMAGYMAFKREGQSPHELKDGYLEIAVKPIYALLQKSTTPNKLISHVTSAMPDCDRQTLCNLLLRQMCSKGATPAMVRAVISAGADVHTLAERPLMNAADNGHTDIAMMLVREHGARLGDAVLELQTWTGDRQKLKDRLYALMAHEYNRLTAQPEPANLPVLSKQAVAAKRPTP